MKWILNMPALYVCLQYCARYVMCIWRIWRQCKTTEPNVQTHIITSTHTDTQHTNMNVKRWVNIENSFVSLLRSGLVREEMWSMNPPWGGLTGCPPGTMRCTIVSHCSPSAKPLIGGTGMPLNQHLDHATPRQAAKTNTHEIVWNWIYIWNF